MPNDDLERTLELLAGASELGELLQQRLVDYAVARKNIPLLVVLAQRDDLSADLSRQVLAVGNAAVIAERARTMLLAGKTEEVQQLLATEKRATVTRGLAAMADLPDEVYRVLVETDRLTTLTALARNEHAPTTIREDAAVHVLTRTACAGVPDNLKATLLQLGGVAEKVIAPQTGPKAWQFAVEHCACTSEDRSRAARLLAARLGQLSDPDLWLDQPGGRYQRGAPEILKDVARLAEVLALRTMNPADAQQLAHAITTVLTRIESVVGPTGSGVLTALRARAGDLMRVRAGREFRELVLEARSREDLTAALTTAGLGHLSSVELLALLESEWFSPMHWRAVRYGWDNLRNVRLAIRNPRAGAIAFLRVRVGWLGNFDELLALCDAPAEVLGALVELERDHRLGLAGDILSSHHLTEEHVTAMPLHMLGAAANARTVNFIAKTIETTTRNREAWDALVSIGGEFDGSLADLLETATHL